MKRYLLSLLLSAGISPLASGAPPEQRGLSLSDVVLRLQQLQTEVQQLRGELEMQKHAIDALQRRQRDLYIDLDSRLSGAGASAPVSARSPAPPAAPVASHEPPPAAPTVAPAPVPAIAAGDPTHEQEEYQAAFGLLKNGRYSESITAFRAFMEKYPDGTYADNALYWLGEASYVNRDFTAALGDFNQLLQQRPASPKVPGALLKIGYVHYEQGDWSQARNILERLEKEYPGTTEAQLAGQRLSRMRKEGH